MPCHCRVHVSCKLCLKKLNGLEKSKIKIVKLVIVFMPIRFMKLCFNIFF